MTEYVITARNGDKFRKEILRKRKIKESGKEIWHSDILTELKEQIENELSNNFATKQDLENALEVIKDLQATVNDLTKSIEEFILTVNKLKLEEAKKNAKPEGIVSESLTVSGFEHLKKYNWDNPEDVKRYLREREQNNI